MEAVVAAITRLGNTLLINVNDQYTHICCVPICQRPTDGGASPRQRRTRPPLMTSSPPPTLCVCVCCMCSFARVGSNRHAYEFASNMLPTATGLATCVCCHSFVRAVILIHTSMPLRRVLIDQCCVVTDSSLSLLLSSPLSLSSPLLSSRHVRSPAYDTSSPSSPLISGTCVCSVYIHMTSPYVPTGMTVDADVCVDVLPVLCVQLFLSHSHMHILPVPIRHFATRTTPPSLNLGRTRSMRRGGGAGGGGCTRTDAYA